MIRLDALEARPAGGRHFDTAILALRQAQGEGIWWEERELHGTIGFRGSAAKRGPVNTSTLTLSLSKGEDGNADPASEAIDAALKARLDRLPPSGTSHR